MSRENERSERPTLPPIRDLFQELSHGHHPQIDIPSLTLARLHVSDDYNSVSRLHRSRSPSRPTSSPSFYSGPSQEGPPYSQSLIEHHHHSHASRSHRAHSLTPLSRPSSANPHQHSGVYTQPDNSRRDRSSYSDAQQTPYNFRDSQPPPQQHILQSVNHGFSSTFYRPSEHTRSHSQSSRPFTSISTSVIPRTHDDDDRTPVAIQRRPPPPVETSSRYECTYCGKGFTRPSSLRIHTNSHTGEKPFTCPVESCGRSFSVLSNMRRHARVHASDTSSRLDISSEDESDTSFTLTYASFSGNSTSGTTPSTSSTSEWRHSRSSSVASSSSSRKSRSSTPDSEDVRPEKRNRHHRK